MMTECAMEKVDQGGIEIAVEVLGVVPVAGDPFVFVQILFGAIVHVKRFPASGRRVIGDEEASQGNQGGR